MHARKVFDRIIGAVRTAGAPAVLPFPFALLSEFELRRGKIAAAHAAAVALFLSPKTVEFHLGNTYRKLRVRSRAELVRRVEGLA